MPVRLDGSSGKVRFDKKGEGVALKKGARLANHRTPPFWCCRHEHASWNEAANFTETPFSGVGEFLELDESEHSNSS
jgi:hypothetical protein